MSKSKYSILPPLDAVRDRLRYFPDTGEFCWREDRGPVKAGDPAGCLDTHGYVKIRLNYRLYYAHRIAYYLMTGEDPLEFQIDHVNLNRRDNRWVNLRKSDQPQNMWNTVRPSTNTSGIKGVSWNKTNQAWYGEIKRAGKKYRTLGCPTPEIAERELLEIRNKLHGAFANHG
jgi:HNH endonuclease